MCCARPTRSRSRSCSTTSTKAAELFTGDGAGGQGLADAMHGAWLALARTGDPNPPALARVRHDPPRTMRFDDTVDVVDEDPTAPNRRAWEPKPS